MLNDLKSELEDTDSEKANAQQAQMPSQESWPMSVSDQFVDEFEPPVEQPTKDDVISEHWLIRLRVVLWSQDQTLIAGMLLALLLFMAVYFSFNWFNNRGLVDIDGAAAVQAEFKVDINSAELGEIVLLPGVGRKLAQAILDHRNEIGGFQSLDQLCDVPGIGQKTLDSLERYILPIRPNSPGG